MPETRDNILFEMVSQASDNLQATLEELIKVLEVQLNKDIPYDTCNVEEILNKTLLVLKPQILEKNVDIAKDLQENTIHYPKAYLESIIYNLLSNAVKYSRPNVRPYIIVKTYSENGQIFLSVKDNGLGIDLNKYGDHVFKLNKIFHQGFDSKGIGLFMTKNQIQTLGGSIVVKSKPMDGSEFVVKF
ncbi:ATP-binding protein [Dyadobacter sp. CY347]|uniref:ATP-binding protein n=1 Tax=Dyadobacter sp. CY347 TaxID=2909336 RepID=UPI001F436727|nr:HAMP domain-containing sensor histidine kinase [Dyadobacter sp. CY347]MCF2489088.1 HAMP domain-containing histidine kinase [Dyadobacter sp. CY347]